MLVESLSANDVCRATSQIPQRDTTEMLLILNAAHQVLDCRGVDVARRSRVAARRKTNENLGALALITRVNDADPIIVVELVVSIAVVVIIVELDKERVKLCFLDHLLHVKIRSRGGALRCSGDHQRGVKAAEFLNHADIRLVVCHMLGTDSITKQ